jgi:putative transposase
MRGQGQELEAGKLEEEKSAGGLSVEKMFRVAVVSRAGYYRSLAERSPDEEEMMLRSLIQKVVVEHRRRYGYRRIWFELNHKLGAVVNHRRVLRLMPEENLLALQRKVRCQSRGF